MVLATMQRLESLRILVALRCPQALHPHPTDGRFLCTILQPLKDVHAKDYQVVVTEPLEEVQKRLGSTPFRLLERSIPVRKL